MTGVSRRYQRLCTLLLPALLVAACGPAERPPIVLVSIDTLRSDRLPVYGYDAIATPHIDALRADAILYERAYSPSATTLPSHATMLTGLLPPDHGVRGNKGYTLEADRLPYLPTQLADAGYATAAAVASFVLRAETGLAAGFDLFEDDIEYRSDAGSAGFQRTGAETLDAIRPWLREVEGPWFLFLHLYDPHTPYTPPEPYASRYASPYDAEVAAVDEVIGDLVDELRQLGLYDDAVVLLTSDHGEGLGDHQEAEHGIFLYRESIQIPLILKLPGGERAGESVAAPAQLADLAPTLLELAGLDVPEQAAGNSLLTLDERPDDRRLYAETFFPRFYFGWSELVSVIEGRHHFIDSPEPELYDLITDPAESENLIDQRVDVARRLRRATGDYDLDLEEPEDTDLETWERLASLGYVGHGQARVDVELPAPASQAHLLETIRLGLRHAVRGEHALAAERLTEVVRENPYALVAWEQLGRSLERLGRAEEAHQAYLRALEISGSAPHLLFATARLAQRLGDPEAAIELARQALQWDEAGARALLAEIALAAGDLETAEREARAAVAARTPNSAAMFTLAQVQLRRGDLEAALETTHQNERQMGRPVPRLDLLRANILASMERFDEAETALRREIENFPDSLLAYTRLALYLARRGQTDDAVATVRAQVENNPTLAGYLAAARSLELLGDSESAAALRAEGVRRFPQAAARRNGGA